MVPVILMSKMGSKTLLFRVAYMTGKTIRKSKRIMLVKVSTDFTSKKKGQSCHQEGPTGSSVMLAVFFFLSWLVDMYVGVLFILFIC